MKFIFWQNIISIHQSAFLNALSEKHELILVVEKDLVKERKQQGWSIPGLGKINIVVAPTEKQMNELQDETAIHVFSGIYAYPMVNKAFRQAVKRDLRVGAMLEPFEWRGFTGNLRWLKYKYLSIKYKHKLDFILTTGEKGTYQYQSVGFNIRNIFEWGYFVDQGNFEIKSNQTYNNSPKPKLLFVGRIDDNKNIMLLIETVKKFSEHIERMTIVGDGPLKTKLLSNIAGEDYIDYRGLIVNEEVREQMYLHDLLILPSKYDGWGAVVNEALHAGMRVIASENCGASVLLDGEVRGEKFQFKGENDFEKVLLKWIKKGSVSADEKVIISEWANKNISGKAAAKYFERIINYVYDDNSDRPIAPWKY